jgi:NAD dependent epimerase/dehydratase family enzyme
MWSHTIAIAGANGMAGRHLVKALLARGNHVIALVRSPESHRFPPSVAVRRPRLFPMSKRMMELLWGERAALFLNSHRMVPQLALSTGFQFHFPTLDEALSDLLGPHPLSMTQLLNQERNPGRA